jgi:hypothetical protein
MCRPNTTIKRHNLQEILDLRFSTKPKNKDEDCTTTTNDVESDSECSTSTGTSTEGLVEQKSVRFSKVQVRNYAAVVGDHPLTRYFPLSIDWHHTEEQHVDLDEYEKNRAGTGEVRRLNFVERLARVSQASINGISRPELPDQEEQRVDMLDRQAEEEEEEANTVDEEGQ